MPAGRPSDYSDELAVELCSRIAMGNSLRKICEDPEMPSVVTVYNWLHNKEEFLKRYAYAKEESADSDADKLDEIAEKVLAGDYEPQQARVAADIIKWSAGKKRPKKYGDRIQTEHSGNISHTDLTDEQLNNKLQTLLDATGQSKSSTED